MSSIKRKRKVKIVRKKPVTKAALIQQIKELTDRCEWAGKIIQMQQKEVDRLMTLTETLTSSISNLSRSV